MSEKHQNAQTTTASSNAAHGEHPDAAYLKRDDIGLVIAKGMAVMYK